MRNGRDDPRAPRRQARPTLDLAQLAGARAHAAPGAIRRRVEVVGEAIERRAQYQGRSAPRGGIEHPACCEKHPLPAQHAWGSWCRKTLRTIFRSVVLIFR